MIQSLADAGSEVIDGILLGSRTYENVLVPETAGELTIPEIRTHTTILTKRST